MSATVATVISWGGRTTLGRVGQLRALAFAMALGLTLEGEVGFVPFSCRLVVMARGRPVTAGPGLAFPSRSTYCSLYKV